MAETHLLGKRPWENSERGRAAQKRGSEGSRRAGAGRQLPPLHPQPHSGAASKPSLCGSASHSQ